MLQNSVIKYLQMLASSSWQCIPFSSLLRIYEEQRGRRAGSSMDWVQPIASANRLSGRQVGREGY